MVSVALHQGMHATTQTRTTKSSLLDLVVCKGKAVPNLEHPVAAYQRKDQHLSDRRGMAEQAHNATRNTPQHNEQQKNNASGRQSQQRKTAARHYATQHRGTTPRNDTRHNATGATRRMPRLWSDRCTSEYPKEVLPIYHVYETTAIVIYQTLHTSVDRLQQTEHQQQ